MGINIKEKATTLREDLRLYWKKPPMGRYMSFKRNCVACRGRTRNSICGFLCAEYDNQHRQHADKQHHRYCAEAFVHNIYSQCYPKLSADGT